ncbi:MAG: amino acid permease [Verrucomicrobia bacterium]|nr:amino acid permease [Verrucomicrobiota bacterium]
MTERKISGLTATNIVVANMIGTGVFVSLGFQVISIHSDFAIMALWIIGGLLSLCGALCYAELAVALPRLGGEYNFLSRIYHPALGFMAGWISVIIGFPAPIALSAMAFGTYTQGIVPSASPLILSLVLIWGVTLILLVGIRTGEHFQNVSTILKIGLIICLIGYGIFFQQKLPLHLTPQPSDLAVMLSGPFSVSLVYVMYSYSGWNGASYLTAEVRNPQRNVPWALFIGTISVMILYVLLNWVFLISAPAAEIEGKPIVALISGRHLFGQLGGALVSGLISFGLIANVSGMSWVGSRVTKSMADDFSKLAFLGRVNQHGTPYIAMILQALVVTAFILTNSFEAVLVYTQFVLLLSSFLAVLGLIVLRFSQPNLPRPYRVWGYPITPLIFLVVTLFMMLYTVQQRTVASLLGLLTALVGLGIYYIVRPRQGSLTAR